MLTRIHKWGSGLGVRIPESLATDAGMEAGSIVELTIDRGRLIVTPMRDTAYRLEDLVARITNESRHDEIPTRGTMGREAF